MSLGLLILCGGIAALVIAAAIKGAGVMTIVLITFAGTVAMAIIGRGAGFSAGLTVDDESCADGGDGGGD